MTRHVVQFSGGIGSFCAALRVVQQVGTADLVLLFADTLVEDEDLYRFLNDAAAVLGVPVTRVADGRTPWQVFADRRFLGNSRLAPCSAVLKQIPCRKWLDANADPADTIVYVGIDSAERHRIPGIDKGWAPWKVAYPMDDAPFLTKDDMFTWCRSLGIATPRLYRHFLHNNCGGSCVRAGQSQWRRLLEVYPDRFAVAEKNEDSLRAELGDVTILRRTRNGVRSNLPLRVLREEHQATD